jgi:hypothetical protein
MALQIANRLLSRYLVHDEAIIISCFYNPTRSAYRLKVFNQFYKTIKHMPHAIVECVCDASSPFELPDSPSIDRIRTSSVLWHKEALLNRIVSRLPKKYKYVFWVDADVLFTNKQWIVDGVEALNRNKIIQPFEYCVHLDRDEVKPSFNLDAELPLAGSKYCRHPQVWRSFASNTDRSAQRDNNYDVHGHVGFAWGIRREILDRIPLYDHALVGGADHIIAHAAMGHIGCECIRKSFTEDIKSISAWSRKFFAEIGGNMGFVPGNLYHLWHGDLKKRQYLRRVKEFTRPSKQIRQKDANGLYVASPVHSGYVQDYLFHRDTINDFGLLGAFSQFESDASPEPANNRQESSSDSMFNTPSEFIPNEFKNDSHDSKLDENFS